MSTDLKLSRAQISKIIQSRGFLGSLLSKLAGQLMKVAVPLAKNILAPLGITAAAWFKYNDFNNFKQGINGKMKIVQALEDSNILLKRVAKIVKNETEEQKGGFLGTLVGTLGSILLGNLL